MTRTQWLGLGALIVGLGVALYLLFFCPTACH